MLSLSVRIGQAVQIGEAAVVKVEDKQGRGVKLVFATDISPIRILDDGVIPTRFTRGITGRPRPY
ncbi:hypothetical protein ABE527_18485 [Brucella sp. TWI432]